jgi:predicted RNase H-like nuclease (RuvC/YqgF family)
MRRHEEETISAIETRVRMTVAKKDQVITELRARLSDNETEVKELKAMLSRQREELLGNI